MRVGLIGTGFGTRVQAPGFAEAPGVELVAICSAQRARAEAAANEFAVPSFTDDYRELLARDDIELVSVCTPPHLHREMTIAALEAGKHVLCEKPLALDTGEAIEMVERAAAADVVNAVNHQNRYIASRHHFCDLVRSGMLGELRLVRSSHHAGYATSPYMEPYWFTWVSERSKGGGMVNGLLSHHIDLLRYFFGDITDVVGRPATLLPDRPVLPFDYRDGDRLGPDIEPVGRRPVDVDDTVTMMGTIAGVPFGTMASWAVYHGAGERFEAFGSEGTLILDGNRVLAGRADEPSLSEVSIPPVQAPGLESQSPFAALAADLARAVDAGATDTSFATLADGLAVQRVIDAVLG
jgi:predicted dehydrogenase